MEKQLIPQLRFPNFQDKWEKVIISKIANKITDGTHDTPKPIKEGIPFLTAIHVKDGKIDFLFVCLFQFLHNKHHFYQDINLIQY